MISQILYMVLFTLKRAIPIYRKSADIGRSRVRMYVSWTRALSSLPIASLVLLRDNLKMRKRKRDREIVDFIQISHSGTINHEFEDDTRLTASTACIKHTPLTWDQPRLGWRPRSGIIVCASFTVEWVFPPRIRFFSFSSSLLLFFLVF